MSILKESYDVIVVGGGPGGLPAAIGAARMGCSTLLVERMSTLGGMAISGLPLLAYLDRAGNSVVGGIPQEFIDRLSEFEDGTLGHIPCPLHNSSTLINSAWFKVIAFEMCKQAGVDILLSAELAGVKVDNHRISGIKVFSRGEEFTFNCRILIDATGDAAAAYMAGASYIKGNQENGGMQAASLLFNVDNVNVEKVTDYLKKNPEAYKVPDTIETSYSLEFFEKSRGYVLHGFGNIIEKARANGDFDIPRDRIIIATLPNHGVVSVNTTRIKTIDGTNTIEVTDAIIECHKQIKTLMRFFRKYVPGFENCCLSSISDMLGVRETRRVIGLKTLTKDELYNPNYDDAVALGGYNIDIHQSGTEKLILIPMEKAVGIHYGCLISKDIENLILSGRCISTDDYAFSLTRVMPTCMAVGEAAGTAAALSVKEGVSPAALDVDLVRSTLRNNGAIVSL